MNKYIKNLLEKTQSILKESIVADAAKLAGIEEDVAADAIKGLNFASYLELGNAVDLEDGELVRELLNIGDVIAPDPIEEDRYDDETEECHACYGKGVDDWRETCIRCGGKGRLMKTGDYIDNDWEDEIDEEQGELDLDDHIDMTDKVCQRCHKGFYTETSIEDDMRGVLHCDECGAEVKRHQRVFSDDVIAEAFALSTMYALVRKSDNVIVKKGSAGRMRKLYKADPSKYFVGNSPSSKVGDTFGGPNPSKVREDNKLLDKPTLTVRELAKKHNVPSADIASQLAKGIKIEKEHTSDAKVAKEIALDHLNELPDYYDRLKKVEEADNPSAPAAATPTQPAATPPSAGSTVSALAEPADTATNKDNKEMQQGRKEVDDLQIGDEIEVADIDGQPAAGRVRNANGPGNTIVITGKGKEEHMIRKDSILSTPIMDVAEGQNARKKKTKIGQKMKRAERVEKNKQLDVDEEIVVDLDEMQATFERMLSEESRIDHRQIIKMISPSADADMDARELLMLIDYAFDDLEMEFDASIANKVLMDMGRKPIAHQKGLAAVDEGYGEETHADMVDYWKQSLSSSIVRKGVFTQMYDAANQNIDELNAAIADEAESIADRYHGSGEGIGSSDVNHFIAGIARQLGIEDVFGWDKPRAARFNPVASDEDMERTEANRGSRFKNIGEAASKKLACTKCDEVSTQKAWEKNDGSCPKCNNSTQGVAEDINEGLQFWVEPLANGIFEVRNSEGDIHDVYDSGEEAVRVAADLNAQYGEIDEDIDGSMPDLSRYAVYIDRPDVPYVMYHIPRSQANGDEPRFLKVDKETGDWQTQAWKRNNEPAVQSGKGAGPHRAISESSDRKLEIGSTVTKPSTGQSGEVRDFVTWGGRRRAKVRFYGSGNSGQEFFYVNVDEQNRMVAVEEGQNANKTEHSGAKKGKGAFYGQKKTAKNDSNKKRRENDKKAVVDESEILDRRLLGRTAGYETEQVKVKIGQRPKGIGWELKQAGEQTGKEYSIWQRKFKSGRIVPLKNKIVDESELQPVNGDELSRIRQLAGIRVDEVKSGKFNSKMIGKRVKIVSQEDSFGNNHLGEEGVITRASREHTFSQMVPFIIEYGVKLDSGKDITIRRESVRKAKPVTEEAGSMYNTKEEWLTAAKEKGYAVESGGDGKLYAHTNGNETGYWNPKYGGFGTGIFHGLKETADNHQKKIAIDTVRNPDKSLLGGPSAKEAEDTLRRKFGYTDKQIAKLKETASGGATGAGAIASAPTAMGGVQSRNASIYGQTTLRKKPTPKKRPTKEDAGDGIGRSKKE